MGVRYLRVIKGRILGLNVSPLRPHERSWSSPRRSKEVVASFRAEDWRGIHDEYHDQTLVLHLWTYGRWDCSYQLRMKPRPPGIMCIEVKPGSKLYDEDEGEHLLIYGRTAGSFQDAVARFLAFLMYTLKREDKNNFWGDEYSYQYSIDIDEVFKRPVEVERHDGRTAIARAKEHMEREAQKWRQSPEAQELIRAEQALIPT